MVDVDLLGQLISSLEEALSRLEAAKMTSDVNYINRLRVFIFNVHQQINEVLEGKHV